MTTDTAASPPDDAPTGTLTALTLVCSLKKSPAPSSSEKLGREVVAQLAEHGVSDAGTVRVVDHAVAFGVTDDEGDGDAWPGIREQILAADILVLATPIWMGQPASVTKMVLERLDNEVAQTDDAGRPVLFGKVAVVAVVGNEDGAHHTSAELFQSLNDVGYTIPAQGVTYWVGEAMQGTDYNDLDPAPEATTGTTKTAAANAAHLARLLHRANYAV